MNPEIERLDLKRPEKLALSLNTKIFFFIGILMVSIFGCFLNLYHWEYLQFEAKYIDIMRGQVNGLGAVLFLSLLSLFLRLKSKIFLNFLVLFAFLILSSELVLTNKIYKKLKLIEFREEHIG